VQRAREFFVDFFVGFMMFALGLVMFYGFLVWLGVA